jgi:CheY-like chemotaxis protein
VPILLIDDSAPVRAVLRLALESEGHGVIKAANGREGVAMFREHRPTSAEAVRHRARDSIWEWRRRQLGETSVSSGRT